MARRVGIAVVLALVAVLGYSLAVKAAKTPVTICHIAQGNGRGILITVDNDAAGLQGHCNHAGDCVVSNPDNAPLDCGKNSRVGSAIPVCTSACPISPSGD